MSLDQEVADIKQRVEQVQQDRARSMAALDQAQHSYEAEMERLREFGVSTLEEGEELLRRLESEISTEVDRLAGELRSISSG